MENVLEIHVVSLIMLIDYPLILTNADILGQGNLDLIREMSGNFAFYNLLEPCLNVFNDLRLKFWFICLCFRVRKL